MDLWMIGRVDCGHKNNLVALDTMKILIERGNDVRLTVVGDGPDLGELKAKTTSLGLTDAVRFLGWRDNPWQTVSKDAMVFIPSLYESMSIVAREAMIRGIRLTASTIPVFREWIPHRLIAEDFRPESFAEKLLYVQSLEEEDLLKMYAAALARFSDEVFAESFMAYMDGTGQNVAGVGPAASVFYR
jgi:glycosyltransferase involved in cell wall biosynthesis